LQPQQVCMCGGVASGPLICQVDVRCTGPDHSAIAM
jgi:hypothetical protein